MKSTAEEKTYQKIYQEHYRATHKERINKKARERGRMLASMLVCRCVKCKTILPFTIEGRRGKYCQKCKREAYRLMHCKAALSYYKRKKGIK
jgi:hypothetical protein